MAIWVYLYCKVGGCYTVGFYSPEGNWHPESDHSSPEDAARRTHYLNGGRECVDNRRTESEKPIAPPAGARRLKNQQRNK